MKIFALKQFTYKRLSFVFFGGLFGFAICSNFVHAQAPPVETGTANLRIMSYNVTFIAEDIEDHGGSVASAKREMEQLAQCIRGEGTGPCSQRFDLIGLQETDIYYEHDNTLNCGLHGDGPCIDENGQVVQPLANDLEVLRNELPSYYFYNIHYGLGTDFKYTFSAAHLVIASRFPIISGQYGELNAGGRIRPIESTLIDVCQDQIEMQLRFSNVHTNARSGSINGHLEQSFEFADRFAEKNHIFVGDFNRTTLGRGSTWIHASTESSIDKILIKVGSDIEPLDHGFGPIRNPGHPMLWGNVTITGTKTLEECATRPTPTPSPTPLPHTPIPAGEGWFHPGIDIKPVGAEAASRYVYSTHAGFVTYAGPAPAQFKEKGWMVQVESDINRDNVADIKTRYTHLMPNTLMINDVKYRRHTYAPDFFAAFAASNFGRGIPYGHGPYVSRNQLLALMGDSGSPGQLHVQYEIVTARDDNLWNKNLDYFSPTCLDTPYMELMSCPAVPDRRGVFFSVNHESGNKVTGPVYTNPGFKPYGGRVPNIQNVYPAPTPAPQPPINPPDFLPVPPPPAPVVIQPTPFQTGNCVVGGNGCAKLCVFDGDFWAFNLYGREASCNCPYTFGDMQIGAPKPGDPGGITQWCFDNALFPGDAYSLCYQSTPPNPVCARLIAPAVGNCPAVGQEILCLQW